MERNNAAGLFLGLACGDALGRPVEFKSPEQIERTHGQVSTMLGGGVHNKPPGTITDDTELALYIAHSVVECGAFDPSDVARRFVGWYESNPFDIGMMTADTLAKLQQGDSWDVAGQQVWESRPEGQNAGNGSVMRCAPYAIAFADQPERLGKISRQSSAITHADPRCTYGCAILNRTLAGLLTDEQNPLKATLEGVREAAPGELVDALRRIPDNIAPEALQSSGYVVHTLQTGLYHGLTAQNARDGIVRAVNMGHDTDTVGAVTGAVVGARFGADGLPDDWVRALRFDDTARYLPPWWPESQSLETTIREFGQSLTAIN